MMRKTVEEARCSNGENCVSYPALGEPSKLSRSNPGTRCFACEERRVASELERATTNKKAVWLEKEKELRWAKGDGLPEQTEVDCAHEVWERRRSSLLTCERGLRSALTSGAGLRRRVPDAKVVEVAQGSRGKAGPGRSGPRQF